MNAVANRYPARRQVMIDDKLCIPGSDEKAMQRPPDDGLPTPETLRDGPSESRRISASRHHDRAHRRPGQR